MVSLIDSLAEVIWGSSFGAIVENELAMLMVTTSAREDVSDSAWTCTLLVLKKEPEGRFSLSTALDGQVFLAGSLRTGTELETEIWGGLAIVRELPTDEFCNARIVQKGSAPIDVSDHLTRLYSMQLSLPYTGDEELIEPGMIFGLADYSSESSIFGRDSHSFILELSGDILVGTTIPGTIESTLRSLSDDVMRVGKVKWEGNRFEIRFPSAPRGEYELVTRVV